MQVPLVTHALMLLGTGFGKNGPQAPAKERSLDLQL